MSLHIFGHVYSHDCHFIRLRPRLGSFAPNGFLLASIPPHGDTYLSACSQCSCSFLEQHGSACVKKIIIIIIYRTSRCYQVYDIILFFLSASQRYSFGLAASPPHGDIRPCGLPSHGDIRPCGLAPSRRYSALRPRPLTEINFLFASRRMSIYFSLAASRRNRFSICLTVNVDFIFLSPIHGEIDFLFASRRMSILSRFTGLINFLYGSRQEPISFRLHGASCLKAVINVLLASRRDSVSFRFGPDGDIDILSPHIDN